MVAVDTGTSAVKPKAKWHLSKRLLTAFAITSLLLLAFLAWLLLTTAGLRFALSFAPNQLQYSTAKGQLWRGFTLEQLRYRQDGLDVSAGRIELAVLWPELLSKTLRIENAEIEKLTIMQSPLLQPAPTESAQDESPTEWVVVVDQITTTALSFSQKSTADSEGVELVAIKAISGKALRLANQHLQLGLLSIEERRGLAVIAGALDMRMNSGVAAKANAAPLSVKVTTNAAFDEILAWPQPIVFDATISGNRQALQIGLLASPPFDLILQAAIKQPFQTATWNASIKSQVTAIGVLARNKQFTNLSTDLSGSGDLSSARMSGKFALDDAPFQLDSLDANLSEEGAAITLNAFKVTLPNQGWLKATGNWPLIPSAAPGALALDWQNFALPSQLSWPQALSSASGSAVISGYLDALAVGTDLKLRRAALAAEPDLPGTLSLKLQLTPTLINLQTFKLALAPAATAAASGSASVTGQIHRELGEFKSAKLLLQAADFNPVLISADYPGQLGLDAAIDVSFTRAKDASLKPSGSLLIKSLSGDLLKRPISGKGELRFDGAWQPAGALDLRWGNNQITLRPQANADLQASLDFQELALLEARAQGSVQGDLLLIADSSGNKVGIDGALSARLLSFADVQVRELELKLQVPAGQSAPIILALDASGVLMGEQRIDSAKLNVAGTRARHTLSADVQSSQGNIALAAMGSFTPTAANAKPAQARWGRWQGMLNTLSLQPAIEPDAGPKDPMIKAPPPRRAQVFTLQSPSALTVSDALVEFAESCFDSSAGLAFCFKARWPNKGAGQASLSLKRVPIAALLDALSAAPSAELSGALTGQIDVQAIDGQAQQMRANLSQLEPIKFTFNPMVKGDALDTAKSLTVRELALDMQAQMQDGAWRPMINSTLELQEGLSLRGEDLTLAAGDQLSGRVEFKLADMASFEGISEAVGKLSGTISGAFELAGTLAAPLMSGDLRGEQLSAEIPSAGIILKDGVLNVNAAQDKFLLSGSLSSGGGKLEFTGAYAPKQDKERVLLQIKGERVLLVDIPSARVIANPELKLTHDGKLIRVTGKMSVPEANVQLDRFESSVVRSNDVVIIDAPPVPQGAPVRADVAIVLGENVLLKGFGLNGKLAGSLKIRERPNKPSTGRGEIQVTGTYKAYGQDLLIERGKLLFAASPLGDPGLDIRAVRKIDKIRAGVQVRGTASQPELTVWSDPVFEQSEVLSYIVLGRGLKGASGADSALVNQAANALGTAGGNLLAKGIGQRIGLELGVESLSEIGGPAFTAGRYLSPRLYIGYGRGLFNPQTLFILRYKLFDSYEIEALSGREQKIGVNYRHER